MFNKFLQKLEKQSKNDNDNNIMKNRKNSVLEKEKIVKE